MSWIKRNLFFVVGSVLALGLMGAAGWFLYSKYALNNSILVDLNTDYENLRRLNGQNPHPGNDKINNIKAAQDQQKQLRAFIAKLRSHFEVPPRIPDTNDVPKLSDREFSAALSRTIDQLQKQATNSSVILPNDYSFSFQAQKQRVSFAPGSLDALAVQLGEVKAICEVLFHAKINALDSIRRERVSPDDSSGPQTDYLYERSVTNELAVLTPYELTFRCFSTELAGVLTGFGSSPYSLVVKTINVEPQPASTEETTPGVAPAPTYIYQPTVTPTARPGEGAFADQAAQLAMQRRYGIGGAGSRYGRGPNYPMPQMPQTPPPAAYVPPPTPAGPPKPSIVLDEKQLKVTIMLNLLKLTPSKGKET